MSDNVDDAKARVDSLEIVGPVGRVQTKHKTMV